MESKIIFGQMIDYFRRENNLTMEELGEKLGKTKSSISRWISGSRYPKIEEIEEIAHFFNTDVETLIFGFDKTSKTIEEITEILESLHHPRQRKVYNFAKEQLEEQQAESNVIKFPDKLEEETEEYEMRFLGGISAGTGEWLEDEQLETLTFASVPVGADFCLQVNGDSMEPLFHDDEYVFIRKDTNIRSGTIGAIIVNGEAFLKKIYIEDNNLRLVSLNKKYDDVIVTEHDTYKYVGTVVV